MTADPPPKQSTLAAWARDLTIATIFFTRVPVPYDGALDLAALTRAWRAVPLVGAVVGAVGAAVYAAAHGLGLGPAVAALLAVGATALLTGALHEDGLADFADGCGGGRDRAQRLAIMRDSRIGTFGVLALGLTTALRVAALAMLAAPYLVALSLVAAHAVARAAVPLAMTRMDPARGDGLAADAGKPDPRTLAVALALAVVLALGLLGGVAGTAALLAAGMAALSVAMLARRLVGGYTGDVLGAVEQAAETAILVTLAATSGAR